MLSSNKTSVLLHQQHQDKSEPIRLSAILHKVLYISVDRFEAKESDILKILKCYALKEASVRKLRNEDLARAIDITPDLLAMKSTCLGKNDLFLNLLYLRMLLCLVEYPHFRIMNTLLRHPNFIDNSTIPISSELTSILSSEKGKEVRALMTCTPSIFVLGGSTPYIDNAAMKITTDSVTVGILSSLILQPSSEKDVYFEVTVEGESFSQVRLGWMEHSVVPLLASVDDLLYSNLPHYSIGETAFFSHQNKLPLSLPPEELSEEEISMEPSAEALSDALSDLVSSQLDALTSSLDEDNLFSNIFDIRSALSANISESKQKKLASQGGTSLTSESRWKAKDVIGVYFQRSLDRLTFFHNGAESYSCPLIASSALVPAFVCPSNSAFQFNIGQNPFQYPPLSSTTTVTRLLDTFSPCYLRLSGASGHSSVMWSLMGETPSTFTIELGLMIEEYPTSISTIFQSGRLRLYIDRAGMLFFNNSGCPCGSLPRQTWSFITIVYARENLNLQVLVNSTLRATFSVSDVTLSTQCFLGSQLTASMSVVLSFIRIWSKVLFVDSTSSLNGRMGCNGCTSPSLLSSLMFDEGVGDKVYDRAKYFKIKEAVASILGEYSWTGISSDPNQTYTVLSGAESKTKYASLYTGCFVEDVDSSSPSTLATETDVLFKAIEDVITSLTIGACNYLEGSLFSRDFKHKSHCCYGYVNPSYQTLLLLTSCLQQAAHYVELSRDCNAVIIRTAQSLLTLLRANFTCILERKLSLSGLGIAYSLVSSSDFKNNKFISQILDSLLSYCNHEHLRMRSESVILSSLDLFFPFLSDQLFVLSSLLLPSIVDSSAANTASNSALPSSRIVERLHHLNCFSRDYLLRGVANSLCEDRKVSSILKGTLRPMFTNPRTFLAPSSFIRAIPGSDTLLQVYDVVSLNDSISARGLGLVIDVYSWGSSKGVLVLWKSGLKNTHFASELLVYRDHTSAATTDHQSESAYVEILNTNPIYQLEDVQKSLLYGMGQYSKEDVLRYLRTYSTSEFKQKYKLDQHISKLKTKFSAKEVCSLFEKFYDSADKLPSTLNSVLGISATTSVSSLLSMLLADCTSRLNDASAPCGKLLFTMQTILCGVVPSLNGSRIQVPTLDHVLSSASFTSASDKTMTFSSLEETWLVGPSSSSTPSTSTYSTITVLSNLRIDTRSLPDRLSVSNGSKSVTQSGNRSWKSCVCSTSIEPNTGIFKWYVHLDHLSPSRGICMFGVAEADVDCEAYLGHDKYGWGLTTSRESFHSGAQSASDFPFKITPGMTILCTLDSDKGDFFVANAMDLANNYRVFNGLGGKTMYPAFSLFANGDTISLLAKNPSVDDSIVSIGERRQFFLGIPPPMLISFCIEFVEALLLSIPDAASDVLLVILNPLVFNNLPQLLAVLLQFQCTPKQVSPLLSTLTRLLSKCMSISQSVKLLAALDPLISLTATEAILVVTHISSLTAAYIGRVASDLVAGRNCYFDDLTRVDEYSASRDENVSFSSMHIDSWKYKSLFVGGILKSDQSELYNLWSSSNPILDWISAGSTSHQSLKALGGAVIHSTIRCIFVVVAHHIGLLGCLRVLQDRIAVSSSFLQRQPPLFLTCLWGLCENMKSFVDMSTSLDEQSKRMQLRATFILEFEPRCSANMLCETLTRSFVEETKIVSANSTLAFNFVNSFRDHVSLIRSFVFDTFPLGKIKAYFRANEERAQSKIDGFRSLRGALSVMSSQILAKSAMLLQISEGVRSNEETSYFHFNPYFSPRSSSVSASSTTFGHYADGTFGCSQSVLALLKGAFIQYYEYLADEFDSISSSLEHDFVFILLKNLAIVLEDSDHDILAKVDIFHRLHGMLDYCTTADKATSPASIRNVMMTTLKTFFILTFQVAFTPQPQQQSSKSHLSFSFSNSLNRSISGPVTLTSSVFDIVFQLVESMTTSVKSRLEQVPVDGFMGGHGVVHLDSNFDHNSFIDEIAVLLLQLCKSTACLKLLCTPTWLIALLDFCIHSTTTSQFRLLRVVSYVFPQCDIANLNSVRKLPSFLAYIFGTSYRITSYADSLLDIILCFASKEYSVGSFGLVLAKGKRTSDDIAKHMHYVSEEAVTLLRLLCRPDCLWKNIIEPRILSLLESFNSVSTKQRLFHQLVLCSVFGGDFPCFTIGSIAKDVNSGAQYEILSVLDHGDTVKVSPLSHSDSSLTADDIKNADSLQIVPRCLLQDVAFSADIVTACVGSFTLWLSVTARCIHVDSDSSSHDTITVQESLLLELLTAKVAKSLKCLLCSYPFSRVLLCDLIQQTSMTEFVLSTLDRSIGSVRDTDGGSHDLVVEEVSKGSAYNVFYKDRHFAFKGEVTSVQSNGTVDVSYVGGSTELGVKTSRLSAFDRPSTSSRLNKLNKTSISHAGEVDGAALEEYLLACSASLRRLSLESQFPFLLQTSLSESEPKPSSTDLLESTPVSPNPEPKPQSTAASTQGSTGASAWLRAAESNIDALGSRVRWIAESDEKIAQLIRLGFPRGWAQIALDSTGGDVEAAINYILNNGEELEGMHNEDADARFEEDYMEIEAEEFMRQLDQINLEERQQVTATPTTSTQLQPTSVVNAAPKEYYYDDMKLMIVPLYASPSFDSEKIGSLFPSDSLYAVEECIPGDGNTWLKVRLSDYDEEFDEVEGDDPFAWVPRYIDGVEVVFAGCVSDSHGNLADPPSLMYPLQNVSYEIIGTEGVILREGIDLISRELRVVPYRCIIKCDKETINFDGTLRLHVIDPFSGWVSKKRHLVKRCNSAAVEQGDAVTGKHDSVPVQSEKSELQVLQYLTEKNEFVCGDEKIKRDCRFFDSLQGTQYQRFTRDFKVKDNVVDSRLRITGCNSLSSILSAVSSKSSDSLEDASYNSILALSALYSRRILVSLFSELSTSPNTLSVFQSLNHSTLVIEDSDLPASTTATLGSTAVPSAITNSSDFTGRLVKFLIIVCYNKASISYSDQDSPLQGLFSIHLPPFESKMIHNLSTILRDTSALHLKSTLFATLLSELARQIRLAASPTYADHIWTDDTFNLIQLDSDAEHRPSLRFAEFITCVVVESMDCEYMHQVFLVWVIALKCSSISMRHIALIVLCGVLHRIQSISSESMQALFDLCVQAVPFSILQRETGKRLWIEMEDSPLYSRYMQAIMQLLLFAPSPPTTLSPSLPSSQPETSSNATTGVPTSSSAAIPEVVESSKYVVELNKNSCVRFPSCRDVNGSWTLELWLFADSSCAAISSADDDEDDASFDQNIPTPAVPFPATTRLYPNEDSEDNDSEYSDQMDLKPSTTPGSVIIPPFDIFNDGVPLTAPTKLQHRPLVLISSNSGNIRLKMGGNILTTEDDPEQLNDYVSDSALCIGICQGSTERTLDYIVPFNEWVHLAFSYSTRTSMLSFYVDGVYKDAIAFNRLCLPLGALGAMQDTHMKSFAGQVAMLRAWNYAKSEGEIERDMRKKSLDYKGIISMVNFTSTSEHGNEVVDNGDYDKSCVLVNCGWVMNDSAPTLVQDDVPSFALHDLEEATGIFGESIGNTSGVVELTGVLKRHAFSNSSEPFSAEFSEVITLCYRVVENSSQIQGYIQWCGRHNLRSLVTGTVSADGAISLRTGASSVVYGAPGALIWLNSLDFSATLVNGSLEGAVQLDVTIPCIPKLELGACRFNKRTLCRHLKCSSSRSTISYDDGMSSSYDGPMEGSHVCTVEVHPSTIDSSDTLNHFFVPNSGCMWIEWKIASYGSDESICIGICSAVYSSCGNTVPFESISYSGGFILNEYESHAAEKFVPGDIVSLEINSDAGCVSFYRNHCFQYSYTELNSFSFASTGYSPFVSLSSPGDSVVLLSAELTVPKRIHLKYFEDDVFNRKEFIGLVCKGLINGKGCLSYHDRPGHWLGYWKNGLQHGTQLWVDVNESMKEVLLEAHEFDRGVDVRTLPTAEFEVNADVLEWQTLRPSFSRYVVDASSPPLSKFKEGASLDVLMEQSTAEYILNIVLESGATVRTGVDIDKSPEVRKLHQGDVVEAFSKVLTEDNIQRYQLHDGYISERLRGGNDSIIAKMVRHLFPKSKRYRIINGEGAHAWSSLQMSNESACMIPVGTVLDIDELRVLTATSGERSMLKINPSTPGVGGYWISEEDASLCTKLLSTHLQVELNRKTLIRQERTRKKSESVDVTVYTTQKGSGTLSFSAETLFLINDSHPDMSVSSDFTSVSLCADNTRALVLGSKGFSRGVHYWYDS